MAACYKTTRRVEFIDTDAAGIMHFSHFFVLMEQAEHEWLRQLGTSVVVNGHDGTVSWPRVHASCDFHATVKFEDVIEIELTVQRLGETSVTYAAKFTHKGRHIADGTLTAVCCRLSANDTPQPIPIPEHLARKLAT